MQPKKKRWKEKKIFFRQKSMNYRYFSETEHINKADMDFRGLNGYRKWTDEPGS